MKTFKILFALLGFTFLTACSITVDTDDEDELGRITANAIGNNTDGTLSDDGTLDVEVVVFDRDGIASVRIEVQALQIDFLTTINSNENTQKINQTFTNVSINETQTKIILITLTDNEGNSYTKTVAFGTR